MDHYNLKLIIIVIKPQIIRDENAYQNIIVYTFLILAHSTTRFIKGGI
jgi:hypothetical protein